MTISHETSQSPQRDPNELEQRSDAIRDDLEQTLGAIERRVSPGELVDRSIGYLQENGGELLQKIGATVGKNPLPLLATSASLIWLLAAVRSGPRQRTRSSSRIDMDSGDLDPLSQSFSASQTSAPDMRTDMRTDMRKGAHRKLDAARSRASTAWKATRARAHEYGDDLGSIVAEQPLACGAIALAAGALIGAAAPASAYERDLVARARSSAHRVREQGGSDGSATKRDGS